MIPYGRQYLDEDDIEAVVNVLRSSHLTTGPQVEWFESAFAEYVGAKKSVAVSSATAALHLTLLGLDLNSGDRVITSPITFLSSANAIAFTGATPDFCDVNQSGNIDLESLIQCWDDQTKGVIVVDYAGQPADMKRISAFVKSKGGFVIEDASHAVGTSFGFEKGGVRYHTGGHPWADATVFSFHPVKTMTTGEGGMVTTADHQLADRIRRLRHHGVERRPENWKMISQMDTGPWYYEMHELGYNYRITDIQCALGLSQLSKLERFAERRVEIVSAYEAEFDSIEGFENPRQEAWLRECEESRVSWHLFSPQIDFTALKMDRNGFMQMLKDRGVGSQVLYIPVYLQPWYQERYGYEQGKCLRAESFFEKTLSLPLYPAMSDDDVRQVIEAVKSILT